MGSRHDDILKKIDAKRETDQKMSHSDWSTDSSFERYASDNGKQAFKLYSFDAFGIFESISFTCIRLLGRGWEEASKNCTKWGEELQRNLHQAQEEYRFGT